MSPCVRAVWESATECLDSRLITLDVSVLRRWKWAGGQAGGRVFLGVVVGEGSGGGRASAVSRAPSQVPRTPSADHLRRGERQKGGEGRGRQSERERETEGGRDQNKTKKKQKTKTDEGHKVGEGGVHDPTQVDWGEPRRSQIVLLCHKSHSAGTGCCLRDVPDPSALHCGLCVSLCVCFLCTSACMSGPGVDFSGNIVEARLASLVDNVSV